MHGAEEVEAAQAASTALFGRGELEALPESTLAAALHEAGVVELSPGASVTDALVESGLVESRSAARRAVGDGGAYANNERIADADAALETLPALHGSWLVLRRGKRGIAGVKLVR